MEDRYSSPCPRTTRLKSHRVIVGYRGDGVLAGASLEQWNANQAFPRHDVSTVVSGNARGNGHSCSGSLTLIPEGVSFAGGCGLAAASLMQIVASNSQQDFLVIPGW